jgi:hypothetical protein
LYNKVVILRFRSGVENGRYRVCAAVIDPDSGNKLMDGNSVFGSDCPQTGFESIDEHSMPTKTTAGEFMYL